MPFCNLDDSRKIPTKPPKSASKKKFCTFLGPHQTSGAHISKFPRRIFTKTLFNTIDTQESRTAKAHREILAQFCERWSFILKYWRSHGAKSRGKSEKVGVLLDSGWGIVSYRSMKSGPALLRIYFIFSIFKISKIRPSPQGGWRGLGSCTALKGRTRKVP